MKRALLATIQLRGKPITFGDIRATINRVNDAESSARLRPLFERSAQGPVRSQVASSSC
jgi:hypothetical protein